jgi:HIT domain
MSRPPGTRQRKHFPHTLISARRPVTRFQELASAEKARLIVWINWTQPHLASHLIPAPDAFNLGVNDGPAAGQTMPQPHLIRADRRLWPRAATLGSQIGGCSGGAYASVRPGHPTLDGGRNAFFGE